MHKLCRLSIPITVAFFASSFRPRRRRLAAVARPAAGRNLPRDGPPGPVAGKRTGRTLAGAAGQRFSAVSVVGDRAFTLFGSSEGEFAAAFSVADGKTLWKTRLSDLLQNDSYGDGPRATPAVDSGRVYA